MKTTHKEVMTTIAMWTGIMALVISVLILWWAHQSRLKVECEDRGGRVVHVEGTRDSGWFCDD